MIGFTITDKDILLVVNGQSFTVPRYSVNGEKLVKGIKNGLSEAALIELADPTTYINAVGGGKVTVKGGTVKYNGENMPECLVSRLMDLLSSNLPVQHLVNFYEKLNSNPSRRAVQELYTFLEHKGIPITPEGNLLMYKAINNNWTDKHTGTFLNAIGCKLDMPRNAVCDDADRGCSKGFHAGSLEYVTSFARGYGEEGGDRIVLVEVNPADVVSIPKDCSCQKVRTCKYRVLQEFKGILPNGGVRDTSNPYMEDFFDDDDEEDELETCYECGEELDCDGGCSTVGCENNPKSQIVLTESELADMLDKARDVGANQARTEIRNRI